MSYAVSHELSLLAWFAVPLSTLKTPPQVCVNICNLYIPAVFLFSWLSALVLPYCQPSGA